jgi:hypothetical protein
MLLTWTKSTKLGQIIIEMKKLSKQQLLERLKYVYTLIKNDVVYGIKWIEDEKFVLTSDCADDIVCSLEGAFIDGRNIQLMDIDDNKHEFYLLLVNI